MSTFTLDDIEANDTRQLAEQAMTDAPSQPSCGEQRRGRSEPETRHRHQGARHGTRRGCREREAVEKAKQLGVDLIIVDHATAFAVP